MLRRANRNLVTVHSPSSDYRGPWCTYPADPLAGEREDTPGTRFQPILGPTGLFCSVRASAGHNTLTATNHMDASGIAPLTHPSVIADLVGRNEIQNSFEKWLRESAFFIPVIPLDNIHLK